MNPPAGPEAVAAAESELGRPLGDELRDLYAIADGQRAASTLASSGNAPLGASAVYDRPLFVRFHFASLAQALEARRRALSDGIVFDADWMPFAIDDEGSGWAIAPVPDERGEGGGIVPFGHGQNGYDASRGRTRVAPSIAAFLTRALDAEDPLHLRRVSDDPRLADLRQWYLSNAIPLSRPVEVVLARALRPWLGDQPVHSLFEELENYPWLLVSILDEYAACEPAGNVAFGYADDGTRLAHGWLLHAGLIDVTRYALLEAIRRDELGARQRLLSRTGGGGSIVDGICYYSMSFEFPGADGILDHGETRETR